LGNFPGVLCHKTNKKEQQLRSQMAKVNDRTIEEIHVMASGACGYGLELGTFERMSEMLRLESFSELGTAGISRKM